MQTAKTQIKLHISDQDFRLIFVTFLQKFEDADQPACFTHVFAFFTVKVHRENQYRLVIVVIASLKR